LKVIIALENLVVAHRLRKVNWEIEKSPLLNCVQSQLNPVNILVFYLSTLCNISLLTLWSRVPFKKLTGSQLVKKFPKFYGTRRFVTAFTSARHLSLS
jgi:hypothetical protein